MNKLNYIIAREQVIKATREFFYKQKFHEVITEILNKSIPAEENLFPFKTSWQTLNKKVEFILPASPERSIKKILAQGMGNCFSIGHCFRNLENSGRLHSPEFLMLEWYREDADFFKIMDDIKKYIKFVKNKLNLFFNIDFNIKLNNNFSIISLEKEFEKIGINYKKIIENEKELYPIAKAKGYSIKNTTWREIFDQIFVNEIEANFPHSPIFLIDFPAKTSPLCKVQKKKNYLAERFEFYLNGIEIANGNNENTDYKKIEKNMKEEIEKRQENNLTTPLLDFEFIDALKKMDESGKEFAGVGLGIDRLTMILVGEDKILDTW